MEISRRQFLEATAVGALAVPALGAGAAGSGEKSRLRSAIAAERKLSMTEFLRDHLDA